MSVNSTRLLLFDYSGKAIVAPRINAGKDFELPDTKFSDGFTLNGNTSNADLQKLLNSNLTLGGFNFGQGASPVGSGKQSSLDDLLNMPLPKVDNQLGYGNSNFGNTQNQNAKAVLAPYQDFINSFEQSPQNMDQLLQQDSFVIRNGQVGLKVTTDGNGGIQNVSLDPTNTALQSGTPLDFQFPDRAAITAGTVYQFGDISPLPPGQDPGQKPGAPPVFLNNQSDVQPAQQPQNPFRALTPTAVNPASIQPAFNPGGVDSASSAVLQRLLAKQPMDPGTRVFGADSQITPQGAKNIGAVQAGFGVDKQSPTMTENLAMLRNGLAAQAATSTQAITRAVDGRIPVAPSLPFETTQAPQASQAQGNMFEQLQSSVDKQGGGGSYVPFGQGNSQGGGQEQGGQDQEQQRQRKPLRITA